MNILFVKFIVSCEAELDDGVTSGIEVEHFVYVETSGESASAVQRDVECGIREDLKKFNSLYPSRNYEFSKLLNVNKVA